MSPAEAQMLLSMCSTVDNRKPDADAAKAWAAMLNDLRFEDCRHAVVEHYKTSTDWLMPAKVRADVKRIRSKRIAEHPPLIPPPNIDDERAWLREARRRIGDGEVIDCDALYGELKPRDMRARLTSDNAQPYRIKHTPESEETA